MKLTRYQHQFLKTVIRNRSAGFSLGTLVQLRWKTWSVLVFSSIAAGLLVSSISPSVAWTYLGFCVAFIQRDFAGFRTSRITWPVTEYIIDWHRVSELDAQQNKPPVLR